MSDNTTLSDSDNENPPTNTNANMDTSVPKNNDSGYSDKAVEARTLGDEPLKGRERDVAYAAWLRTYSERRSKMAGTLSILAAALTLTGGFASNSSAWPAGVAYAVVGLLIVVFGYFIAQAILGRDREAIEAAAAVHQLRSETN